MTDQRPLPFEKLELIDDPVPRGAAMNMALDEILLDGLEHLPLLRIYRWERAAISIGCFDPADAALQKWPKHEMVRRWTGGGMVEHGHDLTFSLLVPRPLPLTMLPAASSYRLVHAAVGIALEQAGGQQPMLQAEPATRSANASRACFENPVANDLLVSGRKVAGGAQRRTRRGLLHQGSILDDASDGYAALTQALPGVLGVRVTGRSLTAAELALAAELATAKYAATTWLRRF